MLSEQDKKEMLADAQDPKRRQAFIDSRNRALAPMSWVEYFAFLKTTQGFFGSSLRPHKITGEGFKL